MKPKNCDACDALFIPDKHHPYRITCSKKCYANHRHRKKAGLPLKTLTISCKVCGTMFKQKRANNTGYCTKNCKNLSGSRLLKGHPIFGPRKYIKGAGSITTQGYRVISANHPNARSRGKNGKGQILEHIVIMSAHIGRPLYKHETVHHKNGIRNDNRLENLELWSHSHPPGQRIEEKIAWAKEFLNEYGYDVVKEKLDKEL